MKTKFLFIAVIAFLLLSMSAFSQNTINFYNNTDKDIYAAYAYWDQSNSCWTSVGWYKVAPYSEKVIDLGNYTKKVYIHGQTSTLLTSSSWGSGYSFCINNDDAF